MNITKQQRRLAQDTQRAQKFAARMVNPCQLILIRHGETDWNRERRLQGQTKPGPPLNELGWKQATVLSKVLQQRYSQVAAVYSSDLLRAVQTAEVLAGPYNLQVRQYPELRERHISVLQGLTYVEAPSQQPEAWAVLQRSSSSCCIPGGGESLDDLRDRMVAALVQIAAQHAGQRVLVISHGGALHATHRAARGYQAKGKVLNCSISVLLVEPSRQLQWHMQVKCMGQANAHPQLAAGLQQCAWTTAKNQQQQQQQCCEPEQEDHYQQQKQQQLKGSCACSPDVAAINSSSHEISNGLLCSNCCVGSRCQGFEAADGACNGSMKGRLALLVWNDAHDLEERGIVAAAGFGGSAHEA